MLREAFLPYPVGKLRRLLRCPLCRAARALYSEILQENPFEKMLQRGFHKKLITLLVEVFYFERLPVVYLQPTLLEAPDDVFHWQLFAWQCRFSRLDNWPY